MTAPLSSQSWAAAAARRDENITKKQQKIFPPLHTTGRVLGEDVGPPGAGRLAAAVPGQLRGAGLHLRGGGVLPTPFRLLSVLQADMMAMFDCLMMLDTIFRDSNYYSLFPV